MNVLYSRTVGQVFTGISSGTFAMFVSQYELFLYLFAA